MKLEDIKVDTTTLELKGVLIDKYDELYRQICGIDRHIQLHQSCISSLITDRDKIEKELKKQKIKNGIMYISILFNSIAIIVLALKS